MYFSKLRNNIGFLKFNSIIRTFSSESKALETYDISIRSCGSIYDRWRTEKKYSKLPNTDLIFKVNYFDTGYNHESKKDLLTVLALHGAPGSHQDFTIMTEYLHNKGIRVIVPSFPNCYSFPIGVFKHSDEEKAQYIKDFLAAICVSKVDLLICHSGAVFPALLLCLQQEPIVKSLAMLNTVAFNEKMPSMPCFECIKILVRASENPVLWKILKVIYPMILTRTKFPLRIDDFSETLQSFSTIVHGNHKKSKEKLLHLLSTRFPMLYAFSENDRAIGKDVVYEIAFLLGAQKEDICYINEKGSIEREGKESSVMKFMAFEKGSHYVFKKYPDIINEALFNFLLENQR